MPSLCLNRTAPHGTAPFGRWNNGSLIRDGDRPPAWPLLLIEWDSVDRRQRDVLSGPHQHERNPTGLTPSHICLGTGLTPATSGTGRAPATSAPGLVPRLPHLHRDWAHPRHMCPGTAPQECPEAGRHSHQLQQDGWPVRAARQPPCGVHLRCDACMASQGRGTRSHRSGMELVVGTPRRRCPAWHVTWHGTT
jgi:hypothetical protein